LNIFSHLGRIIVTMKLMIINKAQPLFYLIINDSTNQSRPIFLYETQFLAAVVDLLGRGSRVTRPFSDTYINIYYILWLA